MNTIAENDDTARRLNQALRKLHDELKCLILTCSPEFPAEAGGGITLLENVAELQTEVAAYVKETLVVLFQSNTRDGAGFLSMWKERGKLRHSESRSETDIDSAIRNLIDILLRETLILGEEELRAAVKNENLPEMLYYLNTVQGSLSWYQARYLARLNGHLQAHSE